MMQYPPVKLAKPNPNHIYIAALQMLGLAPNLITQNVGLRSRNTGHNAQDSALDERAGHSRRAELT
jgi:NAD-dependent SIR2 family protein deacetylase